MQEPGPDDRWRPSFWESCILFTSKTYSKLKILYIHRDLLSTSIRLRLTDSLVLPHISYCIAVFWPALLHGDRQSLQRLQNSCIRYSYSLRKFDHISESFAESKWLNLEERFQVQLLCSVYKVISLEHPFYLYNKLVRGSDIHSRNTRHRDLLAVPRHSSSLFQRCFSYNATKHCNKLPIDIKEAPTATAFKNKVKKHIVHRRDRPWLYT